MPEHRGKEVSTFDWNRLPDEVLLSITQPLIPAQHNHFDGEAADALTLAHERLARVVHDRCAVLSACASFSLQGKDERTLLDTAADLRAMRSDGPFFAAPLEPAPASTPDDGAQPTLPLDALVAAIAAEIEREAASLDVDEELDAIRGLARVSCLCDIAFALPECTRAAPLLSLAKARHTLWDGMDARQRARFELLCRARQHPRDVPYKHLARLLGTEQAVQAYDGCRAACGAVATETGLPSPAALWEMLAYTMLLRRLYPGQTVDVLAATLQGTRPLPGSDRALLLEAIASHLAFSQDAFGPEDVSRRRDQLRHDCLTAFGELPARDRVDRGLIDALCGMFGRGSASEPARVPFESLRTMIDWVASLPAMEPPLSLVPFNPAGMEAPQLRALHQARRRLLSDRQLLTASNAELHAKEARHLPLDDAFAGVIVADLEVMLTLRRPVQHGVLHALADIRRRLASESPGRSDWTLLDKQLQNAIARMRRRRLLDSVLRRR